MTLTAKSIVRCFLHKALNTHDCVPCILYNEQLQYMRPAQNAIMPCATFRREHFQWFKKWSIVNVVFSTAYSDANCFSAKLQLP